MAPRPHDAAGAEHPAAPGPGHLQDLPDDATWQRWGIDPAWSRRIEVADHTGTRHVWHLLDTGTPDDAGVPIVCVHGNPTWAFLWRSFLQRFGGRHRVVAVDQLGMGYSELTTQRRYVDRVADLDDVVRSLGIEGPFVLAGHDWGGAIAMGWAVRHPERVAGLVLCNTGIAIPEGRSAPLLIRAAASAPLLDALCRGTMLFLEGTLRLSGRRLTADDRAAFRAPYRGAPERAAIADFVDDAPLQPDAPSAGAIADVAAQLSTVTAPVLLAWGAKDPVFDDDFAADLASRFPTVATHRFADAGHLSVAEVDVAGVVDRWLTDTVRDAPAGTVADVAAASPTPAADWRPVWATLDDRTDDRGEAFVDLATGESVSWSALARRARAVAGELRRRGLQSGDRVAVITPPGVDLVAVVYGVWRAGGVTVIADRGLGLRGLGAALRSARPDWVVGPRRALVASRAMRWAPRAVPVDVAALVAASGDDTGLPVPAADDQAAVLFTSGATGPAKGVRYRHRQLAAQRDALAGLYSIGPNDRLVAAFAPFALYGPALGIPTALPDCDVTAPSTLTAADLDAACTRVGATLAFASPAALANVVATAPSGGRLPGLIGLRLVLSAGAPVPSERLAAVGGLSPSAELRTPYGMTEALPIADIDLTGILAAEADEPDGGVCVGTGVPGAEVRIVAVGSTDASAALATGATGDILVRAPWVSDGYDGLWATEREARPGDGWHRSGDVGHVDAQGRLWVEGRAVHVIDTVDGPVTPVPVERAVERALPGRRAAVVGVGPEGCQQVVVVVEIPDARHSGLAPDDVTSAVRDAASVPVAAVLATSALPVDIRHNAKIDRIRVGAWAAQLLAGGGTGARLRRTP